MVTFNEFTQKIILHYELTHSVIMYKLMKLVYVQPLFHDWLLEQTYITNMTFTYIIRRYYTVTINSNLKIYHCIQKMKCSCKLNAIHSLIHTCLSKTYSSYCITSISIAFKCYFYSFIITSLLIIFFFFFFFFHFFFFLFLNLWCFHFELCLD